jgi:hypothetical protein
MSDDQTTQGLIAANMGVTIALISALRDKGLLSREEIAEAIDFATLQLEQTGLAQGTAGIAAHGSLQMFLHILAAPKT